MEVGPLSRGAIFQPLSNPLQTDLRFLHPPLPAVSLSFLAEPLPLWENYGLTVFRVLNIEWVRLFLSAGGLFVHGWGNIQPQHRATVPFGSSLSASFGLFCNNGVYRKFT